MRGSSAGRRCSAGARQCALRRGLREPAAAPVVCGQVPSGICQVCKEQGRNSGSQHGRSNHEHERWSLSSAVAKEVAKGVVHVGQRQEHVKRAGTRMQARAPLQPTTTMVCLAQKSAGSSSGGQDGVQHVAASDLLGKTCKHGRASRERWAPRCRPEVLSAHLRKAWICRAMRLAGLLASTGPSHGRGLTGRRHAC